MNSLRLRQSVPNNKSKYVSIVVSVKKLLEEEYYSNQLYFMVLNIKDHYKLVDIYVNNTKKKVYYYFYCENGVSGEIITELKNEIKSFIKEYKYISYKIGD